MTFVDVQSTIQFDPGFTATLAFHPATYLNKVLVASSQGEIQLWNIRTQSVAHSPYHILLYFPISSFPRTCIHKFPSSSLLSSPSQTHSVAITALTQSPAIDVVGLGFTSGEISVYDVRADERLMRMFMEGGAIRALGFRSGWSFICILCCVQCSSLFFVADGHPVLASASSVGHIALWDLNSGGRLLHMIRGAHDGAVSAVEWVPGQPVLISSGEDNSVKVISALYPCLLLLCY